MIALLTMALGADLVVGTAAPTAQATVDLASAGDTVVFPDGEWGGPVVVDKALTLTSRGGVLTGHVGRTLTLDAPGIVVDGLTIRGSGDDLAVPDACVYVTPQASGVVLVHNDLSDCLFGMWLHQVRGGRVEDNTIVGLPDAMPAKKGNGIQLFDGDSLVVRGNHVSGARDGIYVSVTENSVISDNVVSDQRYGIHYMYSYDNVIERNTANNNTGGIALMESKHLIVRHNHVSGNSGNGILFRDAQDCTITGNVAENNGEGLFFFSSYDNEIAFNVLRGNQVGARVWAGTSRNSVHDNAFIGNREQVFYVSASDQTWGPNYWSDYLGWDQDGDGHGDRPYILDAMHANLLHRFPHAVLLLNSPTLELLGMLQGRLPALRVPTVRDDSPLVVPPRPEDAPMDMHPFAGAPPEQETP